MDVITLLKSDHKTVKALLDQMEKTTDRAQKTRERLFEKFRKEMSIHESIEEEFLYPEMKEHEETKDLILEAYEEHRQADRLIAVLTASDVTDETWSAKLTLLKEDIEHHVKEEENELFPKMRKILDQAQLDTLGAKMSERKVQLLKGTLESIVDWFKSRKAA